MLRLYILRHAKSSWALPGKSDFDRGLNTRGTKDIAKIARRMGQLSYLPDQIYASSSKRTRLTIEGITQNLRKSHSTADFPIEYLENLYSGSSQNYLNALKSHKDNSQSLMLVGHNPTCHSVTTLLAKDGERNALEALSYNFPTGALAVIDVNHKKWTDIDGESGYLRDLILPRNL